MRLALLVALASCGKDHFDHAHNYAFVTPQVFDPLTFGPDLAGADGYCGDAAANADLLGDHVAFMGVTKLPATSRRRCRDRRERRVSNRLVRPQLHRLVRPCRPATALRSIASTPSA